MTPPTIHIVATTPQDRGEAFGDLVADAFAARGYTDMRRRVALAGAEIDLVAHDRVESRDAIVECKATSRPVGGRDINVFAGILDRQRRAHNADTRGYFVSLRGFTETARQQESDRDDSGLILMSGDDVGQLVVDAMLVVQEHHAVHAAGQWVSDGEKLAHAPMLVGHAIGWLWLCRYTRSYVLIHGSGEPLPAHIAQAIPDGDSELSKSLRQLTACGPPPTLALDTVIHTYAEAVRAESGAITLEGLPSDAGVSDRPINLLDLFVPLGVSRVRLPDAGVDGRDWDGSPARIRASQSGLALTTVLTDHQQIAILGAPGAGKTTLLKWLAYTCAGALLENGAEPAHARQAHDCDAVEEPWPFPDTVPLVIRCRELGAGKASMSATIASLASVAETGISDENFMRAIKPRLAAGSALLLVDGLDEITDPGARLAFVRKLRRFLATYRSVRVVVTAREPGFRAVAAALTDVCRPYQVDDLSDADIDRLSRSWYRHAAPSDPTAADAGAALAQVILSSDRIRALARNPLLLTTLLLVKRWLGALPQRRSALYASAIEVLLRTWNVEAHAPISEQEALPQLSYAAFCMTAAGQSRIAQPELLSLITASRSEAPEVLAYASESETQFVDRIELRSSLLTHVGTSVEAGRLAPVYEFRHLTFQEYLTAYAVVNGFYPGAQDDRDPVERLRPHFAESSWHEIVPLAAVLMGRDGGALVATIADAVEKQVQDTGRPAGLAGQEDHYPEVGLLAQCVIDEAQVSPDLLHHVCDVLASSQVWEYPRDALVVRQMLATRYATAIRQRLVDGLMSSEQMLLARFSAVRVLVAVEGMVATVEGSLPQSARRLKRSSEGERLRLLAALTELTWELRGLTAKEALNPAWSAAVRFLQSDVAATRFSTLQLLSAAAAVFGWGIGTGATAVAIGAMARTDENGEIRQYATHIRDTVRSVH